MTSKLVAIYRYPLKSCRPEALSETKVLATGLEGDRELMWIDPEGNFVSQRELPSLARVEADLGARPTLTLDGEQVDLDLASCGPPRQARIWEDTCEVFPCAAKASAFVSARLGRALQLVRMSPTYRRGVDQAYAGPSDAVMFQDGFPILLTNESSLSALELPVQLAAETGMGRFRPNLVVSGLAPFEEDSWARVTIGTAEFAVVKPCSRCEVVDVDQQLGQRASGVLRALTTNGNTPPLARPNRVYFGQNLIPVRLGQIRLGDPVRGVSKPTASR